MKKLFIPIIIIILGLLIYFAYQQEWFKSKSSKFNECNNTCQNKYNEMPEGLKGAYRDKLDYCKNICIQKYK